MATQNHQNLSTGKQFPVHCIEHIGIQLIVERGVKQQAFSGSQVIAATEEQKPSTLAAVGQETKDTPILWAQYLVISWTVPEPTAIK